MRHRNSEVAAISALLENEEFDSAGSLAKALIEECYALFQQRDWYGLQWGRYAYGPYIDKAEANRASRALEGLPAVHQLHSVAMYSRAVQAANPKADSSHCVQCGHPKFAHGFTNHVGCVVKKCDCLEMCK